MSQNLGSESGGNDSDNSLEEPLSFSESRPLNRHSNCRQSLQKKPASDLKLAEASLMRGGAVRSSMHTLSSNNNTSTPTRRPVEKVAQQPLGKETPETTTDVANSVHLGGAGTRRTVYLDENLIKVDRSPSNSINLGQPTVAASSAAGAPSNVGQQPVSTTNGGGGAASDGTTPPTTLLMYNRISNIITPLPEGNNNEQKNEKFGSSPKSASVEDKEKESAIWYEYGCV